MCSLLFLACIALALPSAGAVLYSREKLSEGAILAVSHGTASAFLPANRLLFLSPKYWSCTHSCRMRKAVRGGRPRRQPWHHQCVSPWKSQIQCAQASATQFSFLRLILFRLLSPAPITHPSLSCRAVMLIFAYCCYLFFQLKTHREVSSNEGEGEGGDGDGDEVRAAHRNSDWPDVFTLC